jgi:hypothetical protein
VYANLELMNRRRKLIASRVYTTPEEIAVDHAFELKRSHRSIMSLQDRKVCSKMVVIHSLCEYS